MSTFRQLRTFWLPWVTTFVLACFRNAAAQASYKVVDLGSEGNDNLGCAMSLNDEGWTEIMAGEFAPKQNDSVPAKPLHGRALIDADGFKFDLGTLGGPDTWMMWGEINDFGQIVGFSETNMPDPNGEDICGLGTHLTCLPFLWQLCLPKTPFSGFRPNVTLLHSQRLFCTAHFHLLYVDDFKAVASGWHFR